MCISISSAQVNIQMWNEIKNFRILSVKIIYEKNVSIKDTRKQTKENVEEKKSSKCWMFAHVDIELVYNSFAWKAQLKCGIKT